MNNEEDENAYAVVEELPMENIISRDNKLFAMVMLVVLLLQIQGIQLCQQSPERVIRTAKAKWN